MSPSTRTVAPPDRPTRPTPAAERSRRLRAGWPSTVLAKWIMAVTGVIFALFFVVYNLSLAYTTVARATLAPAE